MSAKQRRLCLGSCMALLCLSALGGCGRSPSTRFFTLAPVRHDEPVRFLAGAPLQIRAVHVPDVLDRPELVSEPAHERLDIHEFEQWGAPLADMMRRVLSEDLAARLPAGMMVPPQAPASGTRGLVIEVQEFEPEEDGQVVLDASWSLLNGTAGQPSESRRVRLQAPAGARSGEAQALAMSRLLGRLADAIVAELKGRAS